MRRSGYLLEYATRDNPREPLADIMGQIHDAKIEGKGCDERMTEHLSTMGKEHLPSHARRKSEDLTNGIASNAGPCSPMSPGRRRSAPNVDLGCWNDPHGALAPQPEPVILMSSPRRRSLGDVPTHSN